MQWQELLRDKRFLYAGGVVAAVGGYALYQRKKSTGSTTSQPAATGGAGLDTTGTDVASWLGNQSGQFQDILSQFQKQLIDTLTALQRVPPAPTPSPGPIVPVPTPAPPTFQPGPIKTPQAPKTVTVGRYTSRNAPWNSTLSGIAQHEDTTVARLLQLNPGIRNPNLIYPNQSVRVG